MISGLFLSALLLAGTRETCSFVHHKNSEPTKPSTFINTSFTKNEQIKTALHVNRLAGNFDPNNASNQSSINEQVEKSRRQMFADTIQFTSSVAVTTFGGCLCCPNPAFALAKFATPPKDAVATYDVSRNALQDAAFAQGMASGMVDYEREAYDTKKILFKKLFASPSLVDNSSSDSPVVLEVGMGSFPNALYYKDQRNLDIIGVDPNDRMEGYAKDSAKRAGLIASEKSNSLRIVHGVSEALPFDDNTCDAVVCTLTLCSVVNPEKSVAEIKRVLKPGGKFLFWEHVLSETDPRLAQQQIQLTPAQVKRADGCHLDRKTGDIIRAAGFSKLDIDYIELKKFGFLNPTSCGIATA